MPMVKRIVYGVLLGIGLFGAVPSSAAEIAAKPPRGDLVLKDDAKCTRCHDELDSPTMLTIGRTKHGTRADARTPTCVTCHGESEEHINKPKTTRVRAKPDRYFGKRSHIPADVRSEVCLGCHKGANRMFWSDGTHAAQNVSCDSCHRVHNRGHDRVRDKRTQAEVCFGCHKKQRIQVHKPSRHPILEGKVTCSDCHNPHGSAGPQMMARDTVNDTCFKCHAEKRGPFLWNHQPVTENCSLCHDPHGTTNASLLKWRSPFLCQQCHEGTSVGTHQGNIPNLSFTTSFAASPNGAILLGRGCVNCHTNIHGGNNPVNDSDARTFRN